MMVVTMQLQSVPCSNLLVHGDMHSWNMSIGLATQLIVDGGWSTARLLKRLHVHIRVDVLEHSNKSSNATRLRTMAFNYTGHSILQNHQY